jgi:hypothetical protein
MHTVKTYPELNMASLRQRCERELALWYVLRCLDTSGKGYVALADLRAFVAERGLFSSETLRRTLRKGAGALWVHGKHANICYTALLKLAASSAVDLRQRPVILSLDDLRGVARLRSSFMGTLFAGKARIMSRGTMAKLTGRTPRTTQNYTKTAELQVTANAVKSKRKPVDLDYFPELAKEGYYLTTVSGTVCLARRMPNTYSATHEIAAWGQVKHCTTSFDGTRGGRLYFTNATACARALQSQSDYTAFSRRAETDTGGTQMWDAYTTSTFGGCGQVVLQW